MAETEAHVPSHKTVVEIAAGVRAIAFFEAVKGALVLVAGFGLLALVHRDLEDLAERLVRHSHLNPASHYPRIFIEAAARTDDARLRTLRAMAGASPPPPTPHPREPLPAHLHRGSRAPRRRASADARRDGLRLHGRPLRRG